MNAPQQSGKRDRSGDGGKKPRKKQDQRGFSYGALELDGSLKQFLSLIHERSGNTLDTLLILEQLGKELDMTIEELGDRMLTFTPKDEEEGSTDYDGSVDHTISCFLLEADALDASFKAHGYNNGLEAAQELVASFVATSENACQGVGMGSHSPAERAAAFGNLRGRAWYTWTIDDVRPMITLLRRCALCHCGGADEMPDDDTDVKPFTKFLAHHWGINAYLDPHIVIGQGGVEMPPMAGMPLYPVGPGWTTAFTTGNSKHAHVRGGAWRQAGATHVAVATFNAGSLIYF